MSRVINVNSPGKVRNQQLRTCAEILRHLSKKATLDDEAKDMIAHLVFCFRIIHDTIEHAAEVWEKRNYWMKAEELRRNWDWVHAMTVETEQLIRNDNWSSLPTILAGLFRHVGHIKIKKFTRSAGEWQDSYRKLLNESEM